MWFQWAGSHMTLEPCMKSHCWRERKYGHQLPPGFEEGESYCLHPERNSEVQVTFDRSIRDAFFPLIWITLLWKISIVPFSDFFYAPSAGLLYLKQFSPDIHAWFSPPFCFSVTWGSQSARECHLCEEMGKENLMLIKQHLILPAQFASVFLEYFRILCDSHILPLRILCQQWKGKFCSGESSGAKFLWS